MTETNYPSDVTDEQWQVIGILPPPKKKRGRPPVDRRAIINAIFYVKEHCDPFRGASLLVKARHRTHRTFALNASAVPGTYRDDAGSLEGQLAVEIRRTPRPSCSMSALARHFRKRCSFQNGPQMGRRFYPQGVAGLARRFLASTSPQQ
jgi:hypothetical protein